MFERDTKKKYDLNNIDRTEFVKSLANQLNAKYYFGVSHVRSHFGIDYLDLRKSRNIVGTIEGYDYCFIELFPDLKQVYKDNLVPSSKIGYAECGFWESRLFIKMKNEKKLPCFHLLSKKTAIKKSIYRIIFALLVLLPAICFITINYNFYLFYIFILFSVIISFICLYEFTSIVNNILNQGKYKISNYSFKKKYVIFPSSYSIYSKNEFEINKLFTDDLCNKLVDYPLDIDIEFMNNCAVVYFGFNKKLSYDLCNRHLKELIEQVKLFDIL